MKDTKVGVIPLIRDSEGRYLLITRTEYPDHKGEWGPIAGHVHENETIKGALIRETKEELNLTIRPIKQIARISLDIPGDVGHWWSCEVISGKLIPNEEIDEYKYFTAEEIKRLKLWPATKKFFENYIWK